MAARTDAKVALAFLSKRAPAPDAGAAERAGVYVSRGDAEWAARLLSCLPLGATVTGRMADDAVTLAARINAALRGTNQAKRGNDARKGGEGA